jgi:translation initiation factor 1
MSDHPLVYSTASGRQCPRCGRPASDCNCKKARAAEKGPSLPCDGVVRIRRETQGRKGKTVSVIHGLAGDNNRLNELARILKQRCGTGGTVKEGTVVIQGDHRERLREALTEMGHTVKLAGG